MGLVCRVVEDAGIATVCVATGRDLIAQVKPPRALFVNHPMGNNFGEPHNKAMQSAILKAAIGLVCDAEQGGVLMDYPDQWSEQFSYFGA